MRRHGKTDANHGAIVAAFRKLGCSVLSLAALGNGAPDLCVGWGGLSILVEVKDGSKPPSARQLTADQKRFLDDWKGGLRLVDSLDAVVEAVELLKGWKARLS